MAAIIQPKGNNDLNWVIASEKASPQTHWNGLRVLPLLSSNGLRAGRDDGVYSSDGSGGVAGRSKNSSVDGLFPIFVWGPLALPMRSPFHFPVPVIHHRLGVAMIATRWNFLAADPRIKCIIAPFDLWFFTHLPFSSYGFADPIGSAFCNGYFTEWFFVPDAARDAKPQHAVNKLVFPILPIQNPAWANYRCSWGESRRRPRTQLFRISNLAGAGFFWIHGNECSL
jgi:hypothetical protein